MGNCLRQQPEKTSSRIRAPEDFHAYCRGHSTLNKMSWTFPELDMQWRIYRHGDSFSATCIHLASVPMLYSNLEIFLSRPQQRVVRTQSSDRICSHTFVLSYGQSKEFSDVFTLQEVQSLPGKGEGEETFLLSFRGCRIECPWNMGAHLLFTRAQTYDCVLETPHWYIPTHALVWKTCSRWFPEQPGTIVELPIPASLELALLRVLVYIYTGGFGISEPSLLVWNKEEGSLFRPRESCPGESKSLLNEMEPSSSSSSSQQVLVPYTPPETIDDWLDILEMGKRVCILSTSYVCMMHALEQKEEWTEEQLQRAQTLANTSELHPLAQFVHKQILRQKIQALQRELEQNI